MTTDQIDQLVDLLVEDSRAYVKSAIQPLGDRLAALEDRLAITIAAPPVPIAGEPGPPGPPGAPGRDADPAEVVSLKSELADLRRQVVELSGHLTAIATKSLATKPPEGLIGPPGPPGLDGKDGIGLTDVVIDRAGHLILTCSDGRTKDAGQVVGRDGTDGAPGQDGAPGINGKDGSDGLSGAPGVNGKDGTDGINGTDGIPGLNGKDGKDGINGTDGIPGLNGKDGKDGINGTDGIPGLHGKDGAPGADGLGFDELTGVLDDRGRLMLRFARGEKTLQVPIPCITDQGVWKAGTIYQKGDGVTHDRTFWIAQCGHPRGRPGATKEWRMAVARGMAGKDRRDLQPDPNLETGEAD